MALASKYVCYSVKKGVERGLPEKTAASLMGCKMTPEQMLKVVRFLSKQGHIRPPSTEIKNVNTGHGGSFGMVIPHWVLHYDSKAFALSFIAHEFAHYYQYSKRVRCGPLYVRKYVLDGAHGKTFKRIERRMLRYFGMEPRYAHAYAIKLIARKDGRVLWQNARAQAFEMMREERQRIAEASS